MQPRGVRFLSHHSPSVRSMAISSAAPGLSTTSSTWGAPHLEPATLHQRSFDGQRISRLNPESEWIITGVPELRIVDDELWQAVKTKQSEIADKFVDVTTAIREHHSNKRLNSAHRPKSLFSGLVFCGCCDGPCSLRGADRFVCSAHVSNASCPNGSTLLRSELEQRVRNGLQEGPLVLDVIAELCAPMPRRPTG
jgi:hypothetical protein